jgi:hypothetical protein
MPLPDLFNFTAGKINIVNVLIYNVEEISATPGIVEKLIPVWYKKKAPGER